VDQIFFVPTDDAVVDDDCFDELAEDADDFTDHITCAVRNQIVDSNNTPATVGEVSPMNFVSKFLF
jgi:hypothetical protein